MTITSIVQGIRTMALGTFFFEKKTALTMERYATFPSFIPPAFDNHLHCAKYANDGASGGRQASF